MKIVRQLRISLYNYYIICDAVYQTKKSTNADIRCGEDRNYIGFFSKRVTTK